MSAYLIIDTGLSVDTKRWMNENSIRLSRGAWLHSTTVDGALCARIADVTLADLQAPVGAAASKVLEDAEERIMRGSLRGRAVGLIANKLRMVIDLSLDIDTIAHAGDLLFMIGRSEDPGDAPEKTTAPRANPLGIDPESVKKFILSVAKDEPIH